MRQDDQKVTSQVTTTERVQRARFSLQMAEFATNIGRRIRDLRLKRKDEDPRWTQDFAARQVRADLTGAQYARWERGEVMPREETLERIAEIFGVPVESLYGGTGVAPAPVSPTDELLATLQTLDRKVDQLLEWKEALEAERLADAAEERNAGASEHKPQGRDGHKAANS
jgi:transcriptional regulator with XRE-family HTH domain